MKKATAEEVRNMLAPARKRFYSATIGMWREYKNTQKEVQSKVEDLYEQLRQAESELKEIEEKAGAKYNRDAAPFIKEYGDIRSAVGQQLVLMGGADMEAIDEWIDRKRTDIYEEWPEDVKTNDS